MPYLEPWLSQGGIQPSLLKLEAERLYRPDRSEGFGTAPERRIIIPAIPEKAKEADNKGSGRFILYLSGGIAYASLVT